MSRTVAEALVLVNWKGVFYERYALDRHVTALEGDNGAGKTTVMIAAYVVLLPDMSRLRFTNLGETGATGGDKGIWGRLGESGRPAYAVLAFRLARGERLLAGVHLERRGEPTVVPTPFVVTGLRDDVRLQDLLLLPQGDVELVPELTELRDNAARLGGRLQVFSSAKDYFAALFEHGVTPMRLGTDEERNKLNEMLKTSMTGGMSKGLLQDLRSFLLKEEGGLADTLQRMRENLDACRRTRTEVREAQTLEREIGAIYEAGEAMFAAAVAATRQRAEELARRVAEKEEELARADHAAGQAAATLRATQEALDAAAAAREAAHIEVQDATTWDGHVREALHWAKELSHRERELASKTKRRDAAAQARDAADEAMRRATERVGAASDARERAAKGLADLQAGLEELHRRADAHRRATERLHDARRALGQPDLDPAAAEARVDQVAADLNGVDAARRELGRRIDDATVHRDEHTTAMGALARIQGSIALGAEGGVGAGGVGGAFARPEVRPAGVDGAEVPPSGADGHVAGSDARPAPVDAARDALATVRGWREAADRRGSLAAEIRAAEAKASRQRDAATRARALGVAWAPGGGRSAVTDALTAAEQALATAVEQGRLADDAVRAATADLDAANTEIRALEARSVAWRDLHARASRVSAAIEATVATRADLDAARAALHGRLEGQRAAVKASTDRREALLTEARQLRLAGGTFPPSLLALRDTLTAELLATHFDDVGVDEAARLEARLGPLAHALVVSDVDAALGAIGRRAADLPTVWLVPEDAALREDPDARTGSGAVGDAIVQEREAVRVTRIPDRPTLGRAARERRATTLDAEARALDEPIAAAQAAEHEIRASIADADHLLAGASTWILGDPAADLDAARRRADAASHARGAAAQQGEAARRRAGELKARVDGFRALLPDAALLDEPDLDEAIAALRAHHAQSERAAAHLQRVGDAPRILDRHVDALRRPPWSEDDVAAGREALKTLDARRDRLAAGLEALRYVAANTEALAWTDAAARLAETRGLVPALQAQLDAAKRDLDTAHVGERGARGALDTARSSYNDADAAHALALRSHDEAAARVAAIGIAEPSDALLRDAADRVGRARRALADADARRGHLQTELGRCETHAESTARDANAARTAADDERRLARPAVDAWARLAPQLKHHNLMATALSARFEAMFGGRGSVNVYPEAQTQRALLLERLRSARGGHEVLPEIERALAAADQTYGEGYLAAWLAVRDWLRARLPAQIAEGDEPLAALERFRGHLEGLVERLDRQERDLRGASEDVARGIEVQIRKARGRVKRLNDHLASVRFGSVRGVRVKAQPVDRMEKVLHALRSGEAQELLFQAGLPIEEALEEIFRRYGGGRTGGQRLLDYREYLHLQVEIQRAGGDAWEVANPTRLSTGEAIGVGAALMMVVLTEWERDANLLRGRRAAGSMRFLFLDEANRLDQANLGTVFDLCRNLDLQLLVAAPEVARAEGCTVFRLVRTRADDGTEQVLVSGRRVVGEG